MTMRRRVPSLFVCCVVLLVVAGCVGGPQNRRVTGTGTPATLSEATQEAAGLTLDREANETLGTRVETTLSGDVSVRSVVEVNVTTPVREYRRDDGVVVGVVSTPAVRPVENRPAYRDPLATLSTEAQVDYAQTRYGVAEVGAGERVQNVTLFGNETALERVEAAARGEPVTVYLTRGRDGDDFVTVIVVAPVGSDVDVAGIAAGVEH
jgi:hypothetical protein